jgi:hypothetical protein
LPEVDFRLSSRPPSPELPGTPDLRDVSRNLSFKSLRDLDANRIRAKVWRSPHEERKHPKTLEQLWLYALAGGSRAPAPFSRASGGADDLEGGFLLAFSARAGLNLFVTVLRNLRNGKLSIGLLQRALFAETAINLGRVLGAFVRSQSRAAFEC